MKRINCVIRPINDVCNLNCTYCNTKFRYSKENFAKSKIKMETLEKLIIGLSENDFEEIAFSWHGGEPLLLENSFYESALEMQSELINNKTEVYNILQTNGTLLTKERIEFFKNNNFFIGISIDGYNYEQNAKRFVHQEDYDKLINNLKLAQEMDLNFSITIVLHEKNTSDIKKLYDYIKQINPKNGVIVNPLFLKEDDFTVKEGSFSDESFYNFLVEFYEIWKEEKEIVNNFIKNVILGINGKIPKLCFLSGRCKNFINMNGLGDMFSTCHENKEYYIGNVNTNRFSEILQNHSEVYKNKIITAFENDNIYRLANENERFMPFQGKGCVKKVVNGKDYYVDTYIKFANYISKNLHEVPSVFKQYL